MPRTLFAACVLLIGCPADDVPKDGTSPPADAAYFCDNQGENGTCSEYVGGPNEFSCGDGGFSEGSCPSNSVAICDSEEEGQKSDSVFVSTYFYAGTAAPFDWSVEANVAAWCDQLGGELI